MRHALRNYALVTGAYWAFTLTDGALRMLVLLHFYTLGYGAFQIALLFVLYEFFGVITNLVGGWIAARLGLKVTLLAGLSLQVAALFMLSAFDVAWSVMFGMTYVMGAQALSGIAKDLTKMSAKSSLKTLVPDGEHSTLFKWVAVLTGSKNALKGVGFFLGGFLLTQFGFQGALMIMATGLAVVLCVSVLSLPNGMGQSKAKVKFTHILSKSPDINRLSAARFFLFGARDIWFVVGLPLFLASSLNWSHTQIGSYMAAWVMGYGFVQAVAPKIAKNPDGQSSRLWILALVVVTALIGGAVIYGVQPGLMVVVGLLVFGFVFAINSAVHSYLILAYSQAEDVALNVGFYYMANAGGRLAGTVLSGLSYQFGGLLACLTVSAVFLMMAWLLSLKLPDDREGA
ncbi:MAG: MFS transporter [Rhodospirillaceae bacterium]|nr:MAG: MFS transporter [Rhodospirillaceae bacterium]